MTKDPLEVAKSAQRRLVPLETKAKAARIERDAAIRSASRAGVKVPTIASATGVSIYNVRRILAKKV